MKLLLRCPIISVLILGIAACGGELNRPQAAAAISTRISGPAGSIRVFRERCVEKNFGSYAGGFPQDNHTARQYRALQDAGLATFVYGQPTAEKCGTPYLESKQLIAITLTAKGAAEHWPEHTDRGGGWDVVPARRELVEVTGVVMESDLARAEFTWRLVPTPGGAALGTTPSSRRASATFRRHDDGWHLIWIDDRVPGLRERSAR